MTPSETDTARAATVALVSLPGLGPARLSALLGRFGDAGAAWEGVRHGNLDAVDLRTNGQRRVSLVDRWRARAQVCDPSETLDAHVRAGIRVLLPSDDDWPVVLVDDPEPPMVLFCRGAVAALGCRGAAIVGTRRATAVGTRVARGLGAGVGAAGAAVVSGLALGIDGAAHEGVLEVGGLPVGVVATGLDVVYPARHAGLWHAVAEAGVLVSEAPLGTRPDRWRFPARNRLIAAFSQVIVVVESDERGGSMSTVDAAIERQREVMAVPGPVVSSRSAGTNRLLHEGAGVVRDADDLLMALGLDSGIASARGARVEGDAGTTDAVIDALSTVPVGLDAVASRCALPVGEVATALARHEAAGRVRRVEGGYVEVPLW